MGYVDFLASVAQWIARPPPKGQVAGSIPARGTSEINELHNIHKFNLKSQGLYRVRSASKILRSLALFQQTNASLSLVHHPNQPSLPV